MNKTTDNGSGGGCVRGDKRGMEFLGLEGIWSGGGRGSAEITVGFNKLLEFATTVGSSCG